MLEPANALEVSAISISEVALKAARRRLGISEDQLRQGLKLQRASVLPVKWEYVSALFQVPLHHSDPIERILIATALGGRYPYHQRRPDIQAEQGPEGYLVSRYRVANFH
jgi:PIN domain nuclease of toxin-antitoxin system